MTTTGVLCLKYFSFCIVTALGLRTKKDNDSAQSGTINLCYFIVEEENVERKTNGF